MKAKTSVNVMGIFAGAPKPVYPQDPWIVIPKPTRELPSPLSQLAVQGLPGGPETREVGQGIGSGTFPTVGRNTLKSPTVAISDYQGTLTQRGLRPRGLSDSSIHTTFINHVEGQPGPSRGQRPGGDERAVQEPTSSGMLALFGKSVLGLRSVSSSLVPLSRGATPKSPAPKLTYTSPSTSGSNSIPATANPSANTSAAPSRMHAPINPTQVESDDDDDDLGGPAISRGFFPIAGARMSVDSWSGNEPYVGSMRQEWMTARERGPGARDY